MWKYSKCLQESVAQVVLLSASYYASTLQRQTKECLVTELNNNKNNKNGREVD